MDLNSHKRALGITHIIYGSLTAVIFMLIGAFFDALLPFILDAIREESGSDAAEIFSAVQNLIKSIFYVLLFFCALPSIIGGIGVLQNKNWGMVITLIAGCISIFSFPIGTAIGGYTIFVFIEDNKQKNDKNQG